ncbi:MAG: PD-(D/E)XK nuclease family protein, partial [Verrucomicrobiota bacterium]|nr:PD-(D/E)XK nuclease family protein [Verrucomicrobiota bacterium]
AIEQLWRDLGVEEKLQTWADNPSNAWHVNVWDQACEWLEGLRTAFAEECASVSEWLPILETGLDTLTIGLIPPLLDQVVIGAIDRSRNPDLKMVLLLGWNDGIFPAPPRERTLLAEHEIREITETGILSEKALFSEIAQERFYAYIACTRARNSVIISYSRTGDDGKPLNPSHLLTALKRVAQIGETIFSPRDLSTELLHPIDLLNRCIAEPGNASLGQLGTLADPDGFLEKFARIRRNYASTSLSLNTVQRLVGDELKLSVTSLRDLAQCPYRFFAQRMLNARKREEFILEATHLGEFQHTALKQFHEAVRLRGKEWREIKPDEAVEILETIQEQLFSGFNNGLLNSCPEHHFVAENKFAAVQKFILQTLSWFNTYQFNPVAVEVGFGPGEPLDGLQIELDNGKRLLLRGRIDRIDILEQDGEASLVVLDFKSSEQALNKTELFTLLNPQLPGYLAVMQNQNGPTPLQNGKPVGAFYVSLNTKPKSSDSRKKASKPISAFKHKGIFSLEIASALDSSRKSNQFALNINNDGSRRARSFAALTEPELNSLLATFQQEARSLGNKIFNGEINPFPHKYKSKTACDFCEVNAVCRFDPWVGKFRIIQTL